MPEKQLRNAWHRNSASSRTLEDLRFDTDGLVLGASVLLAKGDGPGQPLSLEGGETRLKTLLAVAYGRPVTAEALGHLKAAIERWNAGDEGQAALHLALSRLGRLDRPEEAARQLSRADGLMRAGVSPKAILAGFDAEANDAARKYSPDQPRIPAGRGRPSGRWTTGGGGASTSTANPHPPALPGRIRPALFGNPARFLEPVAASAGELGGGINLGRMAAPALVRLATFVTALAEAGVLGGAILVGGVAAAVGIVVAPSRGPKGVWVHVGGQGDLSYFLQPDQTAIRFRYTTATGEERIFTASPDPDGHYRGPNGEEIATWVRTAGKIALVINTAALLGHDNHQPRLCPAPSPDRNGPRPKDQDFEDFMKAQVNPQAPTPRGMAYHFYNPADQKFVVIDDCQQSTGFPFEYKGTGFAGKVEQENPHGRGLMNYLFGQAKSQLKATQGRQLIWVFAEKDAADYVRFRFNKDKDLKGRIIILDVSEYEKIK